MKKITRYGRNGGDLEPLENGPWVRHEDLKQLQDENERLEKRLNALSQFEVLLDKQEHTK